MAKSTFCDRSRPGWRASVVAPLVATLGLVAPLSVLAESSVNTQHISFASGHVVIEADPAVERYALVVSGAPGHCDPGLRVDERDNRMAIVRSNGECRDDLVVTFKVNPAWAAHLDLTMKLGQIDLATSIIDAASRIDAKVKFGDIVGRDGVNRPWLVGAQFSLDRRQPGLVIRTQVQSGQISFL